MHDFILIRDYQAKDQSQCEELVKNYLMECSREAFTTVLFKEVTICYWQRSLPLTSSHALLQITLQLVVLICALCFIFFGMPPLICLCSVPVVLLFIFLSVYGAYFNKAVDLCNVSTWSFHLSYGGYNPFLSLFPDNSKEVLGGWAPF